MERKTLLASAATAVAAMLLAMPASADAATLYGADGSQGNPSNLYILDPATGGAFKMSAR